MGDMYGFAFPDRDRTARMMLLLGVLNLNPGVPDIRIRDAWLERVDDGLQIALYSRAGGPNREAHATGLGQVRAHPLFRSDRDDTYCTLRLGVDSNRLDVLMGSHNASRVRQVFEEAAHDGEVDTDARWREAIARVERGELTPTQIAAGDQLIASINEALNRGGTQVIHPPWMPGDPA